MDDDQDPKWMTELPELVNNILDIIVSGCGCDMVCAKAHQDACGCLYDTINIIAMVREHDAIAATKELSSKVVVQVTGEASDL